MKKRNFYRNLFEEVQKSSILNHSLIKRIIPRNELFKISFANFYMKQIYQQDNKKHPSPITKIIIIIHEISTSFRDVSHPPDDQQDFTRRHPTNFTPFAIILSRGREKEEV